MERFDDRRFGGAIDFADEVFRSLGGYREYVEVARATIDNIASAAGSLDRGHEHRMHGRLCRRARAKCGAGGA